MFRSRNPQHSSLELTQMNLYLMTFSFRFVVDPFFIEAHGVAFTNSAYEIVENKQWVRKYVGRYVIRLNS